MTKTKKTENIATKKAKTVLPSNVKISVIIPVYNASDYLRQCIDSVLRQSFGDIELICVDDGSSDDSLDVLKQYRDIDDRIKIVEKGHMNAGDSRNKGIEMAVGDFLAFVDADDFVEPDMLEKAYRTAIEADADVVWFRCNVWEQDNRRFIETPWTLREGEMPVFRPFSGADAAEKIFNMGSCTPWDKLFRRDFIESRKLRFQSISTCDDMLFTFGALPLAKAIVTVDEVLYHQRAGYLKHLAENVENTVSNAYKALSALKIFLKEQGIYDTFSKSFLNWASDFSIWFYDSYHIPLLHGLIGQHLKNKHLKDLGLFDLPEKDFYNHDLYLRIQEFKESFENEVRVGGIPDVTVIVPVFNAGEVLDSCMDRLVNQTLNNIEILVVNDGSEDNSLQIAKKYAEEDKRITIINNKKLKGHGAAVNQGIKAARADYVSIVEPFDTFDVSLIERLYEVVYKNDLDFSQGDIARLQHDECGNLDIEYRMLAIHEENYNRVIDSSNERAWRGFRHLPYCAVFKKKFLIENEIFFNEGKGAVFTDEKFVLKADIYARRVMYVLETLYYDVSKSYLFSGYPMTELL